MSAGERGRALGWHRALDTLGAVGGPLAAAALLGLVQGLLPEDPAGPWRVVLWLSLLPGLLAALVFARFVADPGQAPNPRFSLRAALAGWPPAFRRYLAAVSLFGAGDVSPVLLVLAATTLLAPQWGALEGAQLAAVLYALRNLAQLLASWPAGWLADRHEHRRVLALGYALGLAAMLLVALACLLPSPLPWLAAAFVASGLSAAFQETLESTVAAELSGLRGLALKLGVLGGANGLSRLAANTVVGALWTLAAPVVGFLWAALLMARGHRAAASDRALMAEASLERQQLWIHLGALVLGLLLGRVGGFGELATALLWPVLAALLLVTFAQIPLAHLREGLADRRFLAAMLGGQFLVIPLVVALLVGALPADPGLRLGVALVLLAPCTDWFVSFTWLGGGDAARALAVTPLTLLLQLALVPAWLGLILPGSLGSVGPAALASGIAGTGSAALPRPAARRDADGQREAGQAAEGLGKARRAAARARRPARRRRPVAARRPGACPARHPASGVRRLPVGGAAARPRPRPRARARGKARADAGLRLRYPQQLRRAPHRPRSRRRARACGSRDRAPGTGRAGRDARVPAPPAPPLSLAAGLPAEPPRCRRGPRLAR
ncbi:MAG: hypothetical protein RML12_07150 [Xanthomonadales bacterium]|nr:hypothetical protein [Xanthomonadales bacterium]